jgi:hypothetical protein
MRDLDAAPAAAVARERKKTVQAGWGAQLLARQDRQGTWGGGLYTPKWTSTTYTMLLLRDLGVPPTDGLQRACTLLLEHGMRLDGGINFAPRPIGETCISGMVLSILASCRHADERVDVVADHLLREQMADGGWNCRRFRGDTHSSMNTTISVLEGLRAYELFRRRRTREIAAAQARGREFLLVHRLFRSHRTGKVIRPEFTRFVFPPRWHYDVLRALDYFQSVDAPRDRRLTDALDMVHARRLSDGRWTLEGRYSGPVFFHLEPVGRPSRWNTLRALRVLQWWEN